MLALPVYRGTCCAASAHARSGPFTVRESTQVTPPKPRLLDRVRGVARGTTAGARKKPTSRGSNATSSSFAPSAIPPRWAPPKVTRFLSSLAVEARPACAVQRTGCSSRDLARHVPSAARQDTRQRRAAYVGLSASQPEGARSRIERIGGHSRGQVERRGTRRGLAAFALVRRPVYPGVEL
jgi:hypothetical protein